MCEGPWRVPWILSYCFGAHVRRGYTTPGCCSDRTGISICRCGSAIVIASDNTHIFPDTKEYKVSLEGGLHNPRLLQPCCNTHV